MTDYDMSIHANPDAAAWAKFYAETRAQSDDPANFDSEENMVGWFANAMMAMHDHLTGQRVAVLPDGSAFFVATVSTADVIDADLLEGGTGYGKAPPARPIAS